jgi:methionyl-tRNA synthetase
MHLIGKEISRFHCVYWPAFLMAAGLPLPRSVRANGWLLFDDTKMSKSLGNIVRAETVDEVLGADALRYFLLREIPFGQDGSFSFDALVRRYNGDLANGYGNLVSRVVNMMHKYFGGVVPAPAGSTDAEVSLEAGAARALAEFGPFFDEMSFSEALRTLWVLVAETDGYLTANAPWKKPADRSDADHAALQAQVLATAAEAIRIITALVYPILPASAAKVWQQLGLGDINEAARHGFLAQLAWGGLKPGTKFGEPAPLFPRAEKDAIERMQNLENTNTASAVDAAAGQTKAVAPEQAPAAASVAPAEEPAAKSSEAPAPIPAKPAPAAEATVVAETKPEPPSAPQPTAPAAPDQPTHITIDDFAKVDLRVAQILVAERVPKADKLLRLEIDLGYEKRQILAGIAQHYEPQKLVGRKIVIVANLAPRKMRGLESNGMLLAASLPPDGAPVLAGFLEDVPLGARLK